MRELSIFVDESGSDGLSDRYYLLTVVMHDQSDSIADSIEAYESALRAKGLPDIPFHASPLMNGKDLYSGFDLRTRKMMLGSFRVFFRHMPVRYHTFAYATRQFASLDKLAGAMRRDIVRCCSMAAIIAPSYFQTPCSGGFFIFRAWKPPVPMAPISNRCLPIPWANRGNAPDRVVFFSPYGPFMEKSAFVCRKSRNPRVETPPQWA